MDLKGFTLLLVDDDADVRRQLELQLQALGCNVRTADNGKTALARLAEESCDLVLLDIIMPDTSGLEVLETIRQTRSMIELPVIMVTSLSDAGDIVRALQLGANDYVTKPFDIAVVFARLHTHLKMRRLTEQNEELMRIATHDLKKPLLVIKDIITVAQEKLDKGRLDAKELNEMHSMIASSANTMQTIIKDFLELNTIESGQIKLKLTPVDVNRLVQETVSRNASYAKTKKVELILDLNQGAHEVMADKARLEQVLENLIGNALKFSPPETQTMISTRIEDDWISIDISDQGPGFKPELLSKAFTKFSQLGNKPTGNETSTGLGLAICKRLIEAQSGEIGIRNNEHAGATAWVRLLSSGKVPS